MLFLNPFCQNFLIGVFQNVECPPDAREIQRYEDATVDLRCFATRNIQLLRIQ